MDATKGWSLMRRMVTLLVVGGLASQFAAGADSEASGAKKGRLRAGAAAVDITPRLWPIQMIGQFSYRPAEKANDPLHARALVLDDGTTRLAIVVVDSCFVKRDVLDIAKKRATSATGIPADRMLVSATHTHSAPPSDARGGTEQERDYRRLLINGIARSIEQANEDLQPAEIGWGVGHVPDEVFNRRWHMKPGSIPPDPFGGTTDLVKMNPPRSKDLLVKPAGPTDPEVHILSVRTTAGKPLALLANYSLHYVGATPPGELSADYFGEFARLVKVRLARQRPVDGFVGILSNGTSGDINNINFRDPRPPRMRFEQIRIVAGKVADAAYRANRRIEFRRDLDLAMAERELTLGVRKVTPDRLEWAKATLAVDDQSKQLPRLAKAYAKRVLEHSKRDATTDIKLQAIRIGELGITAIPFEVFVEIGLEIKKRSPLESTFTIELANGGGGYLPTPKQHALGGYETWLTTNRVEVDASRKITETLLELLEEVDHENRVADVSK